MGSYYDQRRRYILYCKVYFMLLVNYFDPFTIEMLQRFSLFPHLDAEDLNSHLNLDRSWAPSNFGFFVREN